MRLDKYLSYALNVSRRDSRQIIRLGRVKVNGFTTIKTDFYIDEYQDEIFFDGNQLEYHEFIYLMINKPKGYITATRDLELPTILDLIKDYKKYNLFMAGRLDIDTEGFVLLTNDGNFAYNITKPQSKCEKKYYLETEEQFSLEDERLCREGLMIRDGKGRLIKTKPARLEIIESNKAYLTIYEGKYHQIKQMCRILGKKLKYLKRIKIGPIDLDSGLKPGEYRLLTTEEVNKLKN
ncbi:MAG: rRNA pseudouridine synthase [Bacilli bacterium]|nr:rRNA pseudouridine synthase [Bacilli bacterium]MDD4076564.1 pseudouridine synthase [Bacilli bacterium]MDD4387915.1 pseudouridine synthase [Bacilli bacterium]